MMLYDPIKIIYLRTPLYLVFCVALCGLFSCKTDIAEPRNTNIPANTFSCYIDGIYWQADTINALLNKNSNFAITGKGSGKTVTLTFSTNRPQKLLLDSGNPSIASIDEGRDVSNNPIVFSTSFAGSVGNITLFQVFQDNVSGSFEFNARNSINTASYREVKKGRINVAVVLSVTP
jgi:hypothetical protein